MIADKGFCHICYRVKIPFFDTVFYPTTHYVFYVLNYRTSSWHIQYKYSRKCIKRKLFEDYYCLEFYLDRKIGFRQRQKRFFSENS